MMKRYILAFVAACMTLGMLAQKFVRFDTSDGWKEIPYSKFAGLKFVWESTPSPFASRGGEAVDLGLSVKWSNVDFGGRYATSNAPDGGTPAAFSLSEDYALDKEGNLNMANDVVRYEWGGCWRVPTLAEWQELWEKCMWERSAGGFKVIGPNGNSILLAEEGGWASNIRNIGLTCYWTSTGKPGSKSGLCVRPSWLYYGFGTNAWYAQWEYKNKVRLDGIASWWQNRLMVRPVQDKAPMDYGMDGIQAGKAQTTDMYSALMVEMMSGSRYAIPLSAIPALSLLHGEVRVTLRGTSVIIAMPSSRVARFYFAEEEPMQDGWVQTALFSIVHGTASLQGLAPDEQLELATEQGDVLSVHTANEEGTLSVPLGETGETYVIKRGNDIFKVEL